MFVKMKVRWQSGDEIFNMDYTTRSNYVAKFYIHIFVYYCFMLTNKRTYDYKYIYHTWFVNRY